MTLRLFACRCLSITADRLPILLAIAMALLPSLSRRATAQQTWEYSPYVNNVWVALDRHPDLTPQHYQRIANMLVDRSYVVAGATWDTRVAPCPDPLLTSVVERIESVDVDQVNEQAAAILKNDDKLILVGVKCFPDRLRVQTRELDCRTRTWRPVVTRTLAQTTGLPKACFDMIVGSFAPIVRIEDYRGKEASVRIRAGGLITSEHSPANIADDDVLLPIIRRNDRKGEPMDNGIQVAPWTFMTVKDRQSNVLQCDVFSGYRSALGGRSSSRTVKLALAVQPTSSQSILHLTTRDDPPQPLGGYEIHAKHPVTEETELVGVTDWRGICEIPQSDHRLRVLYVRNGGRLLARLPMVPGLDEDLTVQVSDDDKRLQAEGFIKGMQGKIMDLVARRELYTSRFRRHLKNGEFEEAKAQLEVFRKLATRTDLNRDLDFLEARVQTSDRSVQAKIDQLLSDTRQLLSRFLDDATANKLNEELTAARSRSGGNQS